MTPRLRNKDVFFRDPTTFFIPNQGVAKVKEPESDEDWAVLDYELRQFVCEGAYADGLERILTSFLANLDKPEQPAVWVSGFYGSGKSHFARVLEMLWRDIVFPDGERASSKANLPESIKPLFRELETAGRRRGGLWSAAGMLNAASDAESVRLAMLGILFASAGLPAQYGRARFALYLQQQGLYDPLQARLAAAGRDFDHEFRNFIVSTALHEALLDLEPNFAASPKDVGAALRAQFGPATDVGDDDLIDAMRQTLLLQADKQGKPGQLPLTLVVFDELQQFIGEDPERTLRVQGVVEAVSSAFGGGVLFLGTGQAALGSTPSLGKLRDRFRVTVMLDNTDVERVVREVVLRKNTAMEPAVEQALDRADGEIKRELAGSRIAVTSADRTNLVPDYPLLPSRNRFWEATLRAVDSSGTTGQLRNQLRIVLDATKAVADQPLGHVIPGDAIFEQIRADLLQSQVLLPEMNQEIAKLDDGSPDGRLKSRLAALAFLIDRLPTDGPAATGVRPTAAHLGDLLIADLDGGDDGLRGRVPRLLDALVEQGILLRTDDEVHLQTSTGRQWETEFRERMARAAADAQRIADERSRRLRDAVERRIGKLTVQQGESRESRGIELHWGLDRPRADAGKIPVWVRDEWTVRDKTVRDEARAMPQDDPTLSASLPQRESDVISRTIARVVAADETLNARGLQTTAEGQQARSAMESRKTADAQTLDRLIGEIVAGARVYKAGGSELTEGSLEASVRLGAEGSAARLFPKFGQADQPGWDRVLARAQDGNGDALAAVGAKGDPADHPVLKEIAAYIGGAGRKGSDVRDHFKRPPYGWPQDAIDAALVLLVLTGQVSATKNGAAQPTKAMTRQAMTGLDFRGEAIRPPNKTQMLDLRGLVQAFGLPGRTDEDVRSNIPVALQLLMNLSREAGGDAPAPAPPSVEPVREMLRESGNAQLLAAWEARDELRRMWDDWTRAQKRIDERKPRWETLQRMMRHGAGLPAIEALRPQVEAIAAQRRLLAEPDPVPPLAHDAADALRQALLAAHAHLKAERQSALDRLRDAPEWTQLDHDAWRQILTRHGLGLLPEPDVGDDARLLAALDREPLPEWDDKALAIPQRIEKARDEAVRLILPDPVRVTPRGATLRTEAEVDDYLAKLRCDLVEPIGRGRAVIV